MLLLCRLGLEAAAQRQPHLQLLSGQILKEKLQANPTLAGTGQELCERKLWECDVLRLAAGANAGSSKCIAVTHKLNIVQFVELMGHQGVGICYVICDLCVQRDLPGLTSGTRPSRH
jgi:hypothetical protein